MPALTPKKQIQFQQMAFDTLNAAHDACMRGDGTVTVEIVQSLINAIRYVSMQIPKLDEINPLAYDLANEIDIPIAQETKKQIDQYKELLLIPLTPDLAKDLVLTWLKRDILILSETHKAVTAHIAQAEVATIKDQLEHNNIETAAAYVAQAETEPTP